MKSSRVLMVLSLVFGLAACSGDKGTKPDEAAGDANKSATTSGADQAGAQGNATTDSAAGNQKLGGSDAGAGGDQRLVHFAFDSDSVDDQNRAIVESNAQYMQANPKLKVSVQGHTDERGTREYNLALGQRRAKAVARMLKVLGIPDNRVTTTSFGEEKPIATGQGESAWAQNRRVEFVYK